MSATAELNHNISTHRALADDLVRVLQRAASDLGRRSEDVTIAASLSSSLQVKIIAKAELAWREDWQRLGWRERPTDSTPFQDSAALRAMMAAEGDAFLAGSAHSALQRAVRADPKETLLRNEVVPLGHGTCGHIVKACKNCEGACGFPCRCGNGKAQCSSCRGSGSQACYACAGHRTFRNWNASANRYEEVWCQACRGSGSETCSGCGGRGEVVCPSCHGERWHACMECGATGTMTYVGQAVYEARLTTQVFMAADQTFDPSIPEGPVRDGFYVDFKHVMMANVQSVLRDADEVRFDGPLTSAEQPAWSFTAAVPFATVEGECAGALFSARMLGRMRRVANMTRFGDTVLAAEIEAVNKGAKDPQGAITAARRVPVLARVLDAAAGRSKDTIQDIEEAVSWTLSAELLENAQTALSAAIVAVSGQAMRRAWAMTAPLAPLVSVAWIFATPGLLKVGHDAAYIADAITGALLAQIMTFGVHSAGRRAEQRAVGARVPSRAAPRWHTIAAVGVAAAHMALSVLLR